MKSTFKLFGTLALAAVGASMAQAQAKGYGYGYVSASFFQSGVGLYYTGNTGVYNTSFSYSSVGSNWLSLDYNYGTSSSSYSNPFVANAYGVSTSAAQPGGSGIVVYDTARNTITLTNLGANYDVLTVTAYTYGYGSSYAGSWNDIGWGYGVGQFTDSAGLINQYATGYAQTAGLGVGGDYAAYSGYDIYNGSFGASAYYGTIFPASLYAYAYDTQTYYLRFAPGATDTFYLNVGDYHESYSITPGPAAVAPFALGLIAALRRRRKA